VDMVRDYALSLCMTLIATGIFSMLIPGKSMEKVLKFALSLFFLSCLVLPVLQGEVRFSFTDSDLSEWDTQYPEELEQKSNEAFLKLTETNLSHEIELLLEVKGIKTEKIEVSIHIDEENNIDISKCDIYLSGGQNIVAGDLAFYLQKETGVKPNLIVEEG
jgi:hypothetical protein